MQEYGKQVQVIQTSSGCRRRHRVSFLIIDLGNALGNISGQNWAGEISDSVYALSKQNTDKAEALAWRNGNNCASLVIILRESIFFAPAGHTSQY